jgi:hypothetical protein
MRWECSMSNLIESLGTTLPIQRKFYMKTSLERSMGRRKRRWEKSVKQISNHDGKLKVGSSDRINQTS